MKTNIFTQSIQALLICFVCSNHASAWQNEQGIVIAEQKIVTQKPITHHVKNGALIGGIGLSVITITVELAAGALSEGAGTLVALAALGYGGLGAGMGGIVGASTYLFKPDNPLIYEYKVKSLSQPSIYTIRQSSTPIPLNTKVRIIERNHTRLIRKI